MLGAGLNDRDAHFDGAEQFGHFRKTERTEPFDIPDGFIDGIVTLFAGGMTGLAVGGTVEDHQTPFGDGQLHQGGFTHDGELDRTQLRDNQFQSIGTAVFLFGGNGHTEVVFQIFAVVKVEKGFQ